MTALLLYAFLLLLWGMYDYVMFGTILTDQSWGHVHQRTPWATYTLREKAAYRAAQHGFILLTLVGIYMMGGAAQSAVVGAAVAFPFMVHDLAYHLVGGHMKRGSGYDPFGWWEKRKPWSIHYWPIRWYVLATPAKMAYPDGVPARWETFGRLVGMTLGAGVAIL